MVVVINPSEGKPSMCKSIRNFAAVTRVGLDLAKNAFQVHAVDARGEVVAARKLSRGRLIAFFSELPPCVVAMEACSSAHHWGRALSELGHQVRLLPPAHVKPYVRRNKNDAADAAAICEAVGRPGQRFVPVRAIENQAALMRHRTREPLAGQRTAALNALRGHLARYGDTCVFPYFYSLRPTGKLARQRSLPLQSPSSVRAEACGPPYAIKDTNYQYVTRISSSRT
jgi:transposase